MSKLLAAQNDWVMTKTDQNDYPHHDRALKVHNHWAVGYAECEIAAFFKITEAEVILDLQYVHGSMNARQMLAIRNDRARIISQRQNSDKYNRLLGESLTMTAQDWLLKGISPAGLLKEYREGVGQTEKPGGLSITFQKNTGILVGNNPNGSPLGAIRSPEDLIRAVISADPKCALAPVVDTEAEEVLPEVAEEQDPGAPGDAEQNDAEDQGFDQKS